MLTGILCSIENFDFDALIYRWSLVNKRKSQASGNNCCRDNGYSPRKCEVLHVLNVNAYSTFTVLPSAAGRLKEKS